MDLLAHFLRSRLRLIRRKALARGSEIALAFHGALVGLAAGCVVNGMSWISKAVHSAVFGIPMGAWLSSSYIEQTWRVFLGPVAGGIAMCLLHLMRGRRKSAPIVDPIEANALHGGRLSLRDSLTVAVQNLVSNGFGASVGLEAGYTQLSSGIGSKIGRRFNLRREDVRILVGCGAAGAIAAAFNAPLTGAFYAFELIVGTYSAVALTPVVVAALVAFIVTRNLSDYTFVIDTGHDGAIAFHHYLLALVLGAICAFIGILIMKGITATERLARQSFVPAMVRPALGGVVVGLLGIVTPQVMASGHGALHLAMEYETPLRTLVLLLALKSIASAVSIGSGFRGGLFFASLFMGALIGQIFALSIASVAGASLNFNVYAVIGMSSLAAAVIGGPMTMVFLAMEMTGNFSIVALVLIAVICSSFLVRTTFGYSLATWRFHIRGDNIRSAHDISWVKNLTVRTLMRTELNLFQKTADPKDLTTGFVFDRGENVVVVDEGGRYAGMFRTDKIHAISEMRGNDHLEKIITRRDQFLLADMDIKSASVFFDQTRSETLAVVNNSAERKVIGLLSEAHMLRRYSEELDRRRREALGETA